MMDKRYHINVFWSQRDECWVADVPDLKSCAAFGDTPEEAVAEARIAIEGWVETALANNMPVPDARYRPAIYAAAAV
jgi:predicted RNase H-like HicB family nuclease